jgi:hypothetical protein
MLGINLYKFSWILIFKEAYRIILIVERHWICLNKWGFCNPEDNCKSCKIAHFDEIYEK